MREKNVTSLIYSTRTFFVIKKRGKKRRRKKGEKLYKRDRRKERSEGISSKHSF